jgi:hypothetical protein
MHVANGLKKGNIILFLWRFTTVSKQKQWFAVTLFMRFFQPLNEILSWIVLVLIKRVTITQLAKMLVFSKWQRVFVSGLNMLL